MNANAKKKKFPQDNDEFHNTDLSFFLKDAVLLSVDHKGFDVLGKVLCPINVDGCRNYQWEVLRFVFKDEAGDVEAFCSQLLEMEEAALKNMSSFSGVGG